MNHYAGRGLPLIVIYSPLVALMINLFLNWFYIPKYGMIAAALNSTLSYTLMFLINLLYFLKTEEQSLSRMFLPSKNDITNQLKKIINYVRSKRKISF